MSNTRNLLILLGLFVLLILIPDFVKEVPVSLSKFMEYTGGTQLLDQTMNYSPEKAYEMMERYGEKGRYYYLYRILIPMDILIPLVYALFFSVLITQIYKRLPKSDYLGALQMVAILSGCLITWKMLQSLLYGTLGYKEVLKQLKNACTLIDGVKPDTIFTVGGDCGVELLSVSYLNKRYNGALAVIWFDAHGDLNTPASSPIKKFHGMPLRALLGEGDEEIVRQCFSKLKAGQQGGDLYAGATG